MTPRGSQDDHGDVRDFLAELEELVEDLGLDEHTDQGARPPQSGMPAPWGSAGAEAELDEEEDDLPPGYRWVEPEEPALQAGDAEELARLVAAVSTPVGAGAGEVVPLWESAQGSTGALWEAFAPELDPEPPRPWSPLAAMAVIEPAAPPPPIAPPALPRRGRLRRLGAALRSRAFTVVTAAALVVAAAVLAVTRLDLGHTSAPASPVSHAAFAVTLMRTVDATSVSDVASAAPLSTFPASRAEIYMDVVYRNANAGDALRLVISMLPGAGSGAPPTPVDDHTYALPPGGEIAVTIKGGPGGFAPGVYTVFAYHDGVLEQSLVFTVTAATPAASPSAAPSPSASAGALPTP